MSQLVQLQENIDQFEDLDADIFTISNDSPEDHQALKKRMGFTFSMLSDASMNVIDAAGMAGDGMSVRGFSVFDENGQLLMSEENDFWGDEINDTEEKIRKAVE